MTDFVFWDLPLIWAVLLAVAIFSYIVLDGFDLGIGIVFPWLDSDSDRDKAMNTIAPVWDGNETWLVLGGGGLFAAFPLAYAIVMPALYMPITLMLLALVFRGVAFEFRFKAKGEKWIWDAAFFGGSLVAALSQGIALGGLLQGIEVADRAYAGGWFSWLTPFSLFTGLALVAGYGFLGAAWLILKTEDQLRCRAYKLAWPLALVLFAAIALVSLWSPLLDPAIAQRWFTPLHLLAFAPVPLLVLVVGYFLWRALEQQKDNQPFLLGLALFFLSFSGLGISIFPYIVPRAVTIWEGAAPDKSLGFMLVGAAVLLPIIMAYTAYSYWVFRGKLKDEGYHA